MDYIRTETNGQLTFSQSTDFQLIPSCLYRFHNTVIITAVAESGRTVVCFHGEMALLEEERICTCGCRMHKNNSLDNEFRNLCIGGNLNRVIFPHLQLRCPKCSITKQQYISFKAL